MINLFKGKKKEDVNDNLNNNGLEDIEGVKESENKGMKEIQDEKRLERIKEKKEQRMTQIYLIFGILIFIISGFLFFYYLKYLNLNLKETELTFEETEFVVNFKKKKMEFAGYLGNFAPYVGLPNVEEINQSNLSFSTIVSSNQNSNDALFNALKSQVENLITNKEIDYIDKSDQLKQFIIEIAGKTLGNAPKIKEIEGNIGKYGFLPQEVHETIEDNTIQRSFLGIETIKYYTALKTFSYLDSFKSGLGEYVGLNKNDIEKFLDLYIKSGERDIERYLSDCILNPLEISTESESCINFMDFEKYVTINYTCNKGDLNCTNVNFQPKIFKKVIQYIKYMLESESLPILSILLNSLDPNNNTISFTIDINTYSDDEKSLLSEGILNPNVFISTSLINSLRKSHMILGSSIKIDSLKVNKKDVRNSDGTSSKANNSSFVFTIPIQKSVEKEIYDYVYNK
ncbi:MAG: hypothetical protein V3575_02820 [Candidatus Absconditabacteria bacterium]